MSIEELRKKLSDIADNGDDQEDDHVDADNLLLEYIDDPDATREFKRISKWYA